MRILHLLAAGGAGGIETLCKDIAVNSGQENHFCFVWFGGCTADEMKALGLNVIELNASKKDIFTPYRAISGYIKKHDIDIVVVHHEAPLMWLYIMLLKRQFRHLRTAIYIHAHLDDIYKLSKKRGLKIRKLIFRCAYMDCDNVIAISKLVRKSLVDGGHSPKKIRLVYNGVNLKKFDVIRKNVSGNKTEIIYVGRIIREKGVQNIVRGVSALDPETRKKIHCNIVGDGIYLENVKRLCHKLRLDDTITFYGTQRDIPQRLADADFFIHTPEWEEGFGITLIEAMASGLVCMVYSRGALPEIISNGMDGILIDNMSPEGIAETIEYAVNMSPEKYGRISRNARKSSRRFSIENTVSRLDRVFEEMMS